MRWARGVTVRPHSPTANRVLLVGQIKPTPPVDPSTARCSLATPLTAVATNRFKDAAGVVTRLSQRERPVTAAQVFRRSTCQTHADGMHYASTSVGGVAGSLSQLYRHLPPGPHACGMHAERQSMVVESTRSEAYVAHVPPQPRQSASSPRASSSA
jgi:hypothetical protein